MTDKVIENNQVAVMGEIVSDFTFSHEIFGEGFYMVDISVDRLSESTDIIPVMVSERLIDVNEDYKGLKICITGQFRSYNRHEERKNKLVLSVFAREIEFVDEIGEGSRTNQIFRRIYLQSADLPQDAAGKRDRGSASGGKQALREIGLHTLYLLGTERQICVCL